jgi:hypothetical protein
MARYYFNLVTNKHDRDHKDVEIPEEGYRKEVIGRPWRKSDPKSQNSIILVMVGRLRW